jgi:hypothetical protein
MKLSHIENLYRPDAQVILLFKECYALEKIHGTAAGLLFTPLTNIISFSSGGESHEKFVSLFNQEQLLQSFKDLGVPNDKTVKVYGEAYGGKQQGMSHTYGNQLRFIVFDIQIGENFLNVPDAEDVAKKLGLEFVAYEKVSLVKVENKKDEAGNTLWGDEYKIVVTNLDEINEQRDAMSVQAKRNGILEDKPREGVVLRPLIEVTLNNGDRIICKHKGEEFRETATPRPVVDPTKMKVMDDANAIANEWVTATRLQHVLDKMPDHCMEKMRDIIAAMQEDVLREAKGEIVESDAVKKAIGKKAVEMYKNYLKSQIK